MEILSTTDYSIFKEITSNREVNEPHVLSLTKAILEKNMLEINPIIVNENYEIIDGQHRLEAAKRLNVPIYYMVSSEVNKTDISRLNSHSLKWSVMDYINYFTIEKAPGFDKLSHFLNEFPFISPSMAIRLIQKFDLKSTEYKNGRIDTSNYEQAVEIGNVVKSFLNFSQVALDKTFIVAIKTIISTGKYDHETMKRKLEFQPRSLVKCVNAKQYIELLEEIYNYKNREYISFKETGKTHG